MIKEDSYIIISKLYILRKCYIGFTKFVFSSLVRKIIREYLYKSFVLIYTSCFDEIISIKFIILCLYIFYFKKD